MVSVLDCVNFSGFLQPHLMSVRRLRSTKFLVPEQHYKRHFYPNEKVVNVSESDMATAELVEELKSDLIDLIMNLSDGVKEFHRKTNQWHALKSTK